ncbi:hypothetical protein IGI04_012173, partial [Brassica rapa subsp. trilocularis]
VHTYQYQETMKRGFLDPSRKEPAGLCTIRKSTREESIDTLQEASIDSLLDYIMTKRNEQHVSGELSRVEDAGTENATSTSIDDTTSTSLDGTTSTSTYITTSTSIDIPTSSSIDDIDREVTMEDSSELEE